MWNCLALGINFLDTLHHLYSWIEAASLIYSRVMTTKLGDEIGCEEGPSALGTL